MTKKEARELLSPSDESKIRVVNDAASPDLSLGEGPPPVPWRRRLASVSETDADASTEIQHLEMLSMPSWWDGAAPQHHSRLLAGSRDHIGREVRRDVHRRRAEPIADGGGERRYTCKDAY